MANALEMMNADPKRKVALTADRLTAKRVDLNDDGVDEWFIISWADCGATATPLDAAACKGAGYLACPRCDGGYCYVGTARQTDFPGPFLACRSSFVVFKP